MLEQERLEQVLTVGQGLRCVDPGPSQSSRLFLMGCLRKCSNGFPLTLQMPFQVWSGLLESSQLSTHLTLHLALVWRCIAE